MGAVAKAAPDIAASVAAASRNSVSASQSTVLVAQDASVLLKDTDKIMLSLEKLANDLDGTVKDFSHDSKVLMASSDSTIQQAGLVMEELRTLAGVLEAQIKVRSSDLGSTIQAMNLFLEDPALKSTISHIDEASGNLATGTKHASDVVETVDIATRDLRKKAGQVKFILGKIAGMIKISVPFFF